MTIIDPNNELESLIKEYSLARIKAIDNAFPYSSIFLVEDMCDDWKEESLLIKENAVNYRVEYYLHQQLGCYWSYKYSSGNMKSKV